MKALTVRQPWASLIAVGVKHIETRSWATSYRGRLAIHAGKRKPTPERGLMFVGDFHVAQGGTWLHGREIDVPLPFGAVVATAVLADCLPMTDRRSDDAHVLIEPDGLWLAEPVEYQDTGVPGAREPVQAASRIDDQLPYGDFAPGRWAWLLTDVKPTTDQCPACWGMGHDEVMEPCPTCDGEGKCPPVPATGRQGLWEWTPREAS